MSIDSTYGTLDIYMINEVEVTAIQFQFFGNIIISNLSGGLASEYYDWFNFAYIEDGGYYNILGMNISFPNNIPAAEGILTQITFSDYGGGDICFGEDPTYNMLVDPSSEPIMTEWGDCYTPYGCPYPVACNYNPNATIDDGTCIYYDCAGECGGKVPIGFLL